MTVPYQTKPITTTGRILGVQPTLYQTMAKVGTWIPSQLNEMPTIETSHDWMNTPTISKDDQIKEQRYKIEELEHEVQFQKESLINYKNNVSLYTKDYAILEVDFKNSEYENRRLKERITKLEDIENMNVWLMKRVIELSQ